MSNATEPSDEGKAEEYSASTHNERYGLDQFQMGLHGNTITIAWSGSAYEMIEQAAREQAEALNPCGVAHRSFGVSESGVRISTWPQMKALWLLITDEIDRRRINKRQRNSLHTARDKIEDHFEEIEDQLRESAGYYNGHHFREHGEIPEPSYAKDGIELSRDNEVEEDEFVTGRIKHHVGFGRNPDPDEVERLVDQLPLMYGYEE